MYCRSFQKSRERTGSLSGPICLFDNLIESHKVRDIFMAIFNQEHVSKLVSLVQYKLNRVIYKSCNLSTRAAQELLNAKSLSCDQLNSSIIYSIKRYKNGITCEGCPRSIWTCLILDSMLCILSTHSFGIKANMTQSWQFFALRKSRRPCP